MIQTCTGHVWYNPVETILKRDKRTITETMSVRIIGFRYISEVEKKIKI